MVEEDLLLLHRPHLLHMPHQLIEGRHIAIAHQRQRVHLVLKGRDQLPRAPQPLPRPFQVLLSTSKWDLSRISE